MNIKHQRYDRTITMLQVCVLASYLYMSSPDKAEAEDRMDFLLDFYQESDDRMEIITSAFMWEQDLSESLSIRIDGVYDVMSGATPTGAPPSYGTSGDAAAVGLLRGFAALSGATGVPDAPSNTSGDGTSSSGGSSSSSSSGDIDSSDTSSASSSGSVPMANSEDERFGTNIQLNKSIRNHRMMGQVFFSTENDYESKGLGLGDNIDFNLKNTTLSLNTSYAHDNIDVISTGGTDERDTLEARIGLSQLLTPVTILAGSVGYGASEGYHNDQYKVVELNGDLVYENRPDERDKSTVYLSLTQYLQVLRASVEAGYSFCDDSFGITGNAVSLAWFQEVGEKVIVRPSVRFYDQSEADFYAVRFTGSPEYYSSDYRVSELQSILYGVKVIWMPKDSLSINAKIERYEMQGKDGETDSSAYPEANIASIGVGVWF